MRVMRIEGWRGGVRSLMVLLAIATVFATFAIPLAITGLIVGLAPPKLGTPLFCLLSLGWAYTISTAYLPSNPPQFHLASMWQYLPIAIVGLLIGFLLARLIKKMVAAGRARQ